jgi:hypothetical protein
VRRPATPRQCRLLLDFGFFRDSAVAGGLGVQSGIERRELGCLIKRREPPDSTQGLPVAEAARRSITCWGTGRGCRPIRVGRRPTREVVRVVGQRRNAEALALVIPLSRALVAGHAHDVIDARRRKLTVLHERVGAAVNGTVRELVPARDQLRVSRKKRGIRGAGLTPVTVSAELHH